MSQKFRISRSQHRHVDFKDVESEKAFLGALLCNKGAFIKVVSNFNSEMFTNNRIKAIYDKIVEFYYKEGVYIATSSILKTMSLPKNKVVFYERLMSEMKAIGAKGHGTGHAMTLRYKLEQFYDARLLQIGMKNIIGVLSKAKDGDFNDIRNASVVVKELATMIESKSKSAIKVNPITDFPKWLAEFEKWQKHPSKMLGIPTGITPIDKRIIGIRPSEFGLCIADTGVGKSIFLLDVALNCWLKYGDVIYVTIEMPANQLEQRFWCNLSRISYEKFRALKLTDDEKLKLKNKAERYKKHPHKFHIIDMNEGCSVNDIVTQIEFYMKTHDIKMVVIDYMNIIAGAEGKISLDWETQVGIAINLKQHVARRFRIPTWSACQVSGDHLAFSRHIRDNIDIGIKLEETDDTEETGLMSVTYPKSRDFRGSEHRIQTNRNLMKIHDSAATAKQM